MKVLFVSSGNSKFGITPIVKSQGESLKKLNVDLEYFAVIGKGFFSYLKHIPLLKKKLKTTNFDIIHAHYGLCGIISSIAKGNQKLIVSFMGDDVQGAIKNNGTYSLFGNLLVSLNKFYLKKYDFIITKSSSLAAKFNREINYEVIPNGVDLNKFHEVNKAIARKILHINENIRLIIFVSDPERPEKNYHLAKASVEKLNDKNIVLQPVLNIPHDKLRYYFSAADLLLLTSFQEGSPNVIKEAMACNCPIVSTDVGDVEWIIGNTKGCYLTSYEVKETSEKVKDALEFSEKYNRTNGRERIIELGLDSDSIAERIIQVYQKVLKTN